MHPDLKSFLADNLELDPDALDPKAHLDAAGLDSLALVELSMFLAERSGVQISEDLLASAATIEALDRLVSRHLEKQ